MSKYQYQCLDATVVDGDTLKKVALRLNPVRAMRELSDGLLLWDMGFGVYVCAASPSDCIVIPSMRAWGINTPEIRGETKVPGERAREWLDGEVEKALDDGDLVVETIKNSSGQSRRGKYGRYLYRLIVRPDRDLNEEMVTLGYAERYGS